MKNKLFSKKLIRYVLIGMCLLLGGTEQILATHIVGGEIYYTWQGPNSYLITLKVYRDCSSNNTLGTPFDAQAAVGIYNSNGSLFSVEMMLLSEAQVSFVPVILENPCFVLPPDVCVERAVYTKFVTLPATTNGYNLVYQRCCRNPSLINITFPQNSGATYTTHIPGTSNISGHNSSAQFINFPPPALCANAEFFFDHSAHDIDGDSLVYEFCTPLLGGSMQTPAPNPPTSPPYTPVNWSNGYSASYPVASNPAFAIDPHTGLITGTANQMGQYVLGVCVKEYRNGELINTTNRDFQFNVTLCNPNIIATVPEQESSCDGLTVFLENESSNATFYSWDFGVEDITTDTSSVEDPQYTYSDIGTYTITLIANPGWPCADTAYTTFEVVPGIAPEISSVTSECVNQNMLFDFTSGGNFTPLAQFHWDFGAGSVPSSSSEQSPQNVLLNPEMSELTVILSVTDAGCTEITDTIFQNPPDPGAGIVPQESFCEGLTHVFENSSSNAESFLWDFGTPINGDQSTEVNPEFTFPGEGTYTIMLIAEAPLTCPDTAFMLFTIHELLDPFFESPSSQCLSSNSFDFVSAGVSSSNASYSWSFGDSATPSVSSVSSPQNVVFNTAGHHIITLTVTDDECQKSYTDSVWVVNDPVLNVTMSPAEGCPDVAVNFNAEVSADTQIFYDWDLGDGTHSQEESPSNVYTQSGSYSVTVMIYTVTGCIDTLIEIISPAVVVHPVPFPGFTIDPQIVDIAAPLVNVTNTSTGNNNCLYHTSDGAVYHDCSFSHSWSETGYQTITQYLISDFGCTASTIGEVIVNGFIFFAPNSFTPNDDGVNDVWIPVTKGITDYSLMIFNRWGDLIFETFDTSEPWNGEVHNGLYIASDGAYNYIVKLKDLTYYPHQFSGRITLIR